VFFLTEVFLPSQATEDVETSDRKTEKKELTLGHEQPGSWQECI